MQKVIERILNLLAFLLTVDRPVTADEIRHTVAGYDRDSDTAFHRTFERDKDLLRRLGIPIEREATDVFEVEFGYVVHDERYALDDPGLTDEERAALALAVQAVGFGGQPSGQEALMKLGGAVGSFEGTELGADLDDQAGTVALAFAAISERRLLLFDYRDHARRVQPYGLVHRRGRWYLVGTEAGGDDVKVFRLDRAEGPRIGDREGAFTPPPNVNPADAVLRQPWDAGDSLTVATVEFDADVAWIAERELGSGAAIARSADGSIVATVEIAAVEAFFGWLVGFEDRAEIVEPESMRKRFLAMVDGS